jgi:hypothetical protein
MISFTPLQLYPKEKAPGNHWIQGWGGGLLDVVEKMKIVPPPGIEPRPYKQSPSLYLLDYHSSSYSGMMLKVKLNWNIAVTQWASYTTEKLCLISIVIFIVFLSFIFIMNLMFRPFFNFCGRPQQADVVIN